MAEEPRWQWRNDCSLRFSRHAGKRLFERGISRAALRGMLACAVEIEFYPPQGYPDPNYLLLAWAGERPLHLVVAVLESRNEVILVTAYEPNLEEWEPGFRERRL